MSDVSSVELPLPDWLEWPETKRLVAAFLSQPGVLRFVGGAVRDSIIGREVVDIDAATSLLPEDVIALLRDAEIKVVPTGLQHGTVTAIIQKKHFEITTLRKDVACDGRHAQVAYTDNWEEDAARRDFTMNSIYLSPEGRWFDYGGGIEDARNGIVRFIGDPVQRIQEDRLRILRYFRFQAHYGTGPMEMAALEACAAAASQISELSGERIQGEFLKLLQAPSAPLVISKMIECHILFPSLGVDIEDARAFVRLREIEEHTGYVLDSYIALALFCRFASSPEVDACMSIAKRLRLSKAMTKDLQAIVKNHPLIHTGITIAEQKRLMRQLGKNMYERILVLNWACDDKSQITDTAYNEMLELARLWQIPAFPVTGQDLLSIGVESGVHMGELLKQLEAQWEDGNYTLQRRELLALIGAQNKHQ